MVGGLVLDCSVALAWALPDERSSRADSFKDFSFDSSQVWVPAIWWYEVANALAVAARRGRLTKSEHMRLTSLFSNLPVRTDALVGSEAFLRYGTIARDQGLSAYDAAYLGLASRRGLTLATLDKRLADEAQKNGLKTWPT